MSVKKNTPIAASSHAVSNASQTPLERLTALDRDIDKLMEPFFTIVEEIELPFVCLLSDEETIEKQEYPGIYRIDMKADLTNPSIDAWIAAFQGEWEDMKYLAMHSPGIKQKRRVKHVELTEWMPIYLGKSKNVAQRVMEHIYLTRKQKTTGLKLKERINMSAKVFRLCAVAVPVKRYDMIMPTLEARLRDRFHPLVGRQ